MLGHVVKCVTTNVRRQIVLELPTLPCCTALSQEFTRTFSTLLTNQSTLDKTIQQNEAKAQKELDNLSEEKLARKQILETKIEYYKTLHDKIPEEIDASDWLKLLDDSDNSEYSLLKYLTSIYDNQNKSMVGRQQQKYWRETLDKEESHNYSYRRSLRLLPNRQRVSRWNNAVTSMLLGHPLIIDFDYDLNDIDRIMTHRQVRYSYGYNQNHREGYSLHFTGMDTTPQREIDFDKYREFKNFKANMHSENFTDLFPKKKLVYLSHKGPVMKTYDPGNIYIIGASSKSTGIHNSSAAKARQLGIRYHSLPLKEYVSLKHSKILTIDTVMKIMLDMQLYRDWYLAFYKNLPRDMLKGESWDTAALKPMNPSMLLRTSVLYQGTSREAALKNIEKSSKLSEDTDSGCYGDALKAAVKSDQLSVTPPWHVPKWREQENKLFPEFVSKEVTPPNLDFQRSRQKTVHNNPIDTIAEPKKTFRVLKLHNPRRNR